MIKQKQIRDSLVSKLSRYFGMSPAEAGEEQIYKATVLTVRDILAQKNRAFSERVKAGEQKRVYYICLEFLVGRSLRLNLNNLGLEQAYREALADLGFDLDAIYEKEPDPGLGNGGLCLNCKVCHDAGIPGARLLHSVRIRPFPSAHRRRRAA